MKRTPAADGAAASGHDANVTRSDDGLIDACIQGDEPAWRELVARYGPLVYSIPRRYGFSEDDCRDVFQNVFLALLKQLPNLRDRQSLAKWCITTAHRVSWRLMGRDDKTVSLNGTPVVSEAMPPPDAAIHWERQHTIRQALRRMGGPCEPLLTALFLDPKRPGYEEVSQQLGIAVGSIGPSRARCLKKLLGILEASGVSGSLEGTE